MNNNSETIKYELDLAQLPPVSVAQTAELAALSALPDSQIDTSEIPLLSEAFWQQAIRNPFYRPIKQSTTVRVDSDVLMWLKSKGKGYHTRINTILRDAMLHEIRHS